jgi:hypothetical protein
MNRTLLYLLLCFLLFLNGCALRVGPKTIARDRFDYSSALSNSWKEQMIMNMVKVRYLDSPMFMEVALVVASYTFEGSATISLPDWEGAAAGPAAGVGGRWAESPVITYNPLVGEKFTRSLLQPIPPIALFSLVQAGWPIDVVFSIGVRAINGLYASTHIEVLKRRGDTDFYRLLKMLRELQLTGAFALRVQQKGEAESGVVVFRPRQVDVASEATALAVRKMLGLNLEAKEFSLVFGAIQKDDAELALVTRSMFEILLEASAGVEVPAADLQEGRVSKPVEMTDQGEGERKFLIHVRSSSGKPNARDAFSAVRYRGNWFWLDDRDLSSKRGLSFLMTLFTLAESGTTATPPVLTISKP